MTSNSKKIYSRTEVVIDALSITTLVLTFTFSAINSFSYWYLILVLPISMWILEWLCIYLLVFLLSFLCSKTKEYEKPSKFFYSLFNLGYDALIGSGRITVNVSGLEKIPSDSSFLLISNHLSRFDNMIQSYVLRKHIISYISKPSNFKIPFGNRYMNRSLYMKMDRDSILKTKETIEKATYLLSNDITSIGLFPEGTRSKDYEVHDFKAGCFKIATRSKKPIVVVCIDNTQYIHKNFPFKRTQIYMNIVDCIDMTNIDTNTINLAKDMENMTKEDLAKERTH